MNDKKPELFEIPSKHGVDIEKMDKSVNPADDFYLYANNGWKKANPLPEDRSRFGVFDKLHEKSVEQRKELLATLSDNPDSKIKDTDAQKVCDIFSLGMDEERLNSEGAAPLLPFIEKINTADLTNLEKVIAWLHTGLTSTFFSTGVGPDKRDSNKYMMYLSIPGLGLGDRDYYLEKSERNDFIMKEYHLYVKKLMELIGYNEEEQDRVWQNIIFIETSLAENMPPKEYYRNPLNTFNILSLEEAKKRWNNFDWDRYFSEFGVGELKDICVTAPSYHDFVNSFLPTLSAQQIKDLMVYCLVADSTGLLSDEFSDTSFRLFGRVMNGTEERQPRWKRVMSVANSMFGEIIGKLYVEKYFPKENKEYMLALVENLRNALGDHIRELSWMSDTTKAKALEKLGALTVKIGYPDKWKDYSEIHIDTALSYLENVQKASIWITLDNYSKLNEEVDKTEWHMTPQTVNAYYSPLSNEICFPAGILQPPFFDLTADDALNYGGIGVVIGHEMTHGFDDSGRHYDKDGNLIDWWSAEDSGKFADLTKKLVEQFNKVEVTPGIFANGEYTLGENIADQGGLRIGLSAYLKTLADGKGEAIDGFSPLQRFYLAYANIWAENIRPEAIELRTKTDPHSLGKVRVNETLKNISPFMEAFSIPENSNMFRPEEERVTIW